MSATPFFLKGSGYDEGRLFPWVVSDFGLIDAIEAGLVKVPRVPVADDVMSPEGPTYRNLWASISDDLPKKGRKDTVREGAPRLPTELEGALHSLYGNYEKSFAAWQDDEHAQAAGSTPPVFIVVCNNTTVSKLVYDYIAGWEKALGDDESVWVKGKLPLLSNVDADGRQHGRFNTILVDSEQLESGEALSTTFKKLASTQIDEFESELRQRFPGRVVEDLDEATLLREVLNTVGKPGKLGENIRCVVSVSMLTEGWDANTVTHVLGVRAFGTQLLCEQVVGRGLRRRSYALGEDGRFSPEYAEVYGVPFSFIPSSGASTEPVPPKPVTRVRALPEREHLAIDFPHVVGYRTEIGGERLVANFGADSQMVLSRAEMKLALQTEMAGVAGAEESHDLSALRGRRQEVEFTLTARLVDRLSPTDGPTSGRQAWLFPQALAIVRTWLDDHVVVRDDAFLELLTFVELQSRVVDRIERAIGRSATGEWQVRPVLRSFDPQGSTHGVDFDTSRPTMRTDPTRCHVSHVVADTKSWEQQVAFALEHLDEVVSYVKNDHLGFTIPYTIDGQVRKYVPDFIARVTTDGGSEIKLVIEVSGAQREDKTAKVATAGDMWVPAINGHGGFGRWAFVEVTDPDIAKKAIRQTVADAKAEQDGPPQTTNGSWPVQPAMTEI